ncbi:MAG TPA: DUF1465 family protein [Sphingomonas sp.]|nr:DUF1465 family protein [Sphingomonas sp.]
MQTADRNTQMQMRRIDAMYSEAMLLADEARAYFDDVGRVDREALEPAVRVGFSCESLKVTTRLMHVIAWFLTQRAIQAGELRAGDALDPNRRLGDAPSTGQPLLDVLPVRARRLIEASIDLHRRVSHMDVAQDAPMVVASPALTMQKRLAAAL